MQSAWDLVAPSIAQDDAIMSSEGCSTLQKHSYEHGTHGITTGDSSGTKDLLSKLHFIRCSTVSLELVRTRGF